MQTFEYKSFRDYKSINYYSCIHSFNTSILEDDTSFGKLNIYGKDNFNKKSSRIFSKKFHTEFYGNNRSMFETYCSYKELDFKESSMNCDTTTEDKDDVSGYSSLGDFYVKNHLYNLTTKLLNLI